MVLDTISKQCRNRKYREEGCAANGHALPTCAFLPESSDKYCKAGLLTMLQLLRPSRSVEQWLEVTKAFAELTASGNVQDLHLFPFSFLTQISGKPLQGQKYIKKTEK